MPSQSSPRSPPCNHSVPLFATATSSPIQAPGLTVGPPLSYNPIHLPSCQNQPHLSPGCRGQLRHASKRASAFSLSVSVFFFCVKNLPRTRKIRCRVPTPISCDYLSFFFFTSISGFLLVRLQRFVIFRLLVSPSFFPSRRDYQDIGKSHPAPRSLIGADLPFFLPLPSPNRLHAAPPLF